MPFNAKLWYAENRDAQRAKARVRADRFRSLNLRLRSLVLSAQPCTDCGEPPDPETPFEFDHREGIGAKSQRRISDLVTRGTSHIRMLREIAKCDVVCPTCHKERTYNRMQWRRRPRGLS
jgi:hypothetical protein